jgi:hypothetical protein
MNGTRPTAHVHLPDAEDPTVAVTLPDTPEDAASPWDDIPRWELMRELKAIAATAEPS